MRTREEIKDKFEENWPSKYLLEVLLDIRDLLIELKK
jgi:hypothetical protein